MHQMLLRVSGYRLTSVSAKKTTFCHQHERNLCFPSHVLCNLESRMTRHPVMMIIIIFRKRFVKVKLPDWTTTDFEAARQDMNLSVTDFGIMLWILASLFSLRRKKDILVSTRTHTHLVYGFESSTRQECLWVSVGVHHVLPFCVVTL